MLLKNSEKKNIFDAIILLIFSQFFVVFFVIFLTNLYLCVLDSYEAEQLLKEVDIHSVTGILKLYLRELPEALFTDALYPKLFEIINNSEMDSSSKRQNLLTMFRQLSSQNQQIVLFLLSHMSK